MPKKILISAFEPFGNDAINPSAEAVGRLEAPDGIELTKVVLPVVWGAAFSKLSAAWDAFLPDAVLLTGLAGGSDAIRVERLGVNLCGAIRDNFGVGPNGSAEAPRETPACAGEPDGIFSTFSYEKILAALKAAGVPCRASFSAGTYLCNFVLFSSLVKAKREGNRVKVGFVHVPYCEKQKTDAPFLPIDKITEALRIAVSNMI